MSDDGQIGNWHHGPLHLFMPNTLYMVTASTLNKQRIFDSPAKLQLLQDTLFEVTQAYEWELQAGDTCLTYEKSFYARLNYVHNNPVKHGLVPSAAQYSFCSAKWFKENADQDMYDKVISVPYDRVRVQDDFFD